MKSASLKEAKINKEPLKFKLLVKAIVTIELQ